MRLFQPIQKVNMGNMWMSTFWLPRLLRWHLKIMMNVWFCLVTGRQ